MNDSLVTFAICEEARPFLRQVLSNETGRILEIPRPSHSVLGTGTARPVCVALTGIGPHSARQTLRRAFDGPLPSRVLSCGFAGALNPELRVGAVLFSADDGFDFTPALLAAGALPSRFYCCDRVIVTAEEKGALRRTSGADAVEMESGIIREICRERGVPSATVRVVSDSADQDLPLDFNRLVDARGQVLYHRLLWELLKSPGRIGHLIRMRSQTREAAGALAQVLTYLFTPRAGQRPSS